MPVSSVKGDYCNIEGFEPTGRSQEAISRMNDIVDMSKLLEKVLMGVPVYSIFAGRDTYLAASVGSIGYNISTI